jgi:cephalosporin hydroxylase
MSLLNIPISDTTDKNTIHSYLETYESLFHSKQNTSGNILEIGVHFGGSIQLWNNYFKNAKIYGLDIADNISVNEIKDNENIILNVNVDAYNKIFVNNAFTNKNIKFDIMIDDGPHTLKSMILFIQLYLPLLSDDGILVIEDIPTLDWIQPLINVIPINIRQFIHVYDLRPKKNRYDDILLVINKLEPKQSQIVPIMKQINHPLKKMSFY